MPDSDSKPIARVVPYESQDADLIGSLRDKISITGDVFTTGLRWDADAQSWHPHALR